MYKILFQNLKENETYWIAAACLDATVLDQIYLRPQTSTIQEDLGS